MKYVGTVRACSPALVCSSAAPCASLCLRLRLPFASVPPLPLPLPLPLPFPRARPAVFKTYHPTPIHTTTPHITLVTSFQPVQHVCKYVVNRLKVCYKLCVLVGVCSGMSGVQVSNCCPCDSPALAGHTGPPLSHSHTLTLSHTQGRRKRVQASEWHLLIRVWSYQVHDQ